MTRNILITRSMIVLIICLLYSCSIILPSTKKGTDLYFEPVHPGEVTIDILNSAANILQKRINEIMVGEALVAISNLDLRVTLLSANAEETVIQLAVGIGEVVFWGSENYTFINQPIPSGIDYLLTEKDIKKAYVKYKLESWVVGVEILGDGIQRFAEYTTSHIGQYLNIGYEGEIIVSGVIGEALTNGEFDIYSDFTELDAKILAAKINSGRLPYQMREKNIIDPRTTMTDTIIP